MFSILEPQCNTKEYGHFCHFNLSLSFLFFVFTEGEVPLVTVSVIIYFIKGKCERGYFVFVLVFYLLLGVLHGGRHLMQAAPLNSHESTPTAYLFCVKTLVTQTFRAGPGAKDLLIYVGICDKVLLERVM